MPYQLEPATGAGLARIAADRQRKHRVPGLVAGVSHRGELVWDAGVGARSIDDLDTPPGPDDPFIIASNTKTLTAVMVMQLRDEGKLSLDDTVDTHIPEVTHGGITIRSMLSHSSGMQREPVGDVWETMESPDREQLVAGFNEAERVHRPHHVFHYSNLVFSMLGEIVARVDGRDWFESLRTRLLQPLGMDSTTLDYTGLVPGYFVPPYTDVPVPEPVIETRAMAPCGGLASTARDLARWSAFVADPPAEVLSPDTLEEMLQPQISTDVHRWTGAIGLGFWLMRSGERVYAGHTGGMPGQITGLFTDRATGIGAVVLMNSTSAPDPAAFALELADHVLAHDPPLEPAWRPGAEVPDELQGVLGLWYTEGHPFVFTVREGRLEARASGQAEHLPPAVFVRVADDLYRTESGRERGELLRITRDPSGHVSKLNWATYLVTRDPLPFGVLPTE